MDINQWQDPMTADVTVSVPELSFDWSATFKDGEKIELPGFPLEIEGFPIGETDVYLEFSLKKANGTVNFKVFFFLSRMISIFLLLSEYHKSSHKCLYPLDTLFYLMLLEDYQRSVMFV